MPKPTDNILTCEACLNTHYPCMYCKKVVSSPNSKICPSCWEDFLENPKSEKWVNPRSLKQATQSPKAVFKVKEIDPSDLDLLLDILTPQ